MNTPSHPTPEKLNAYFDKELTPAERTSLDVHLQGCSECRFRLDWFEQLTDLGTSLEESLPGDSYWTDLPDRILARINEDAPAAVSPAAGSSIWSRLVNPQGRWRFALGGVMSAVLVAGLWIVVDQNTTWRHLSPAENGNPTAAVEPERPSAEDNTSLAAVTDLDAVPQPPPVSPESIVDRIAYTLGRNGNYGQSLDIQPGQAVLGGRTSGMGTQVTNTLPPLGPSGRAAALEVVSDGCGTDPVESAFLAALSAEQFGQYHLAEQGYWSVRASLPPGQSLRHEAEYRLLCLLWERRMQSTWPQRARAMAELHQVANDAFQVWEKTQLSRDCQRAWCMNRVLLNLGGQVTDEAQLRLTSSRVNQLKNCVE